MNGKKRNYYKLKKLEKEIEKNIAHDIEEKKKVTMYLQESKAKQFRMLCAKTGKSYGDFVEKWLEEELAR